MQDITNADLFTEGLVPLTELPRLLPAGSSGRPLHRAVGWRWAKGGVLGPDGQRVHLEAVRVGKRWMTSRPALARFFAALSGEKRPGSGGARAELAAGTVATLQAFGLTEDAS